MAARGFVAVVGSRELPPAWAAQVSEVVRFFLERGWGIGSGGALGADTFALQAVVAAGPEACQRSLVCLPGRSTSALVRSFARRGGRFVPGSGAGRAALLGRSRWLVQASSGVVAFLWGPSRGSVFTVRQAVRAGKPAAVVLAGGGAVLPAFAGGRWEPCTLGGVAAFRWVREPRAAEGESVVAPAEPKPTALHRIFVVPEGEPVEALMAHISSLSVGERLWFETGVLVGDTIMVQHEALSDTPAFLALPRLRRQFRCTSREAAGLAELFLALDAGPDVVAHYAREAGRCPVDLLIGELVHLVARLALAEEVAAGDALEEAERLGEAAEGVASDGHVAQLPVQSDGESALLGWHAVGSVQPERVECPGCRAVYEADDEAPEIPACPVCGMRDTWEARQGPAFAAFVAEIDGCASLAALGAIGKRLYGLALPHEQASVAWSHFQLRRAALEAAITLGAEALGLLAQVEHASERELPRVGARLYRVQHAGGVTIGAAEWRRIWSAYGARRRARVA
jgi:hypothetical protein